MYDILGTVPKSNSKKSQKDAKLIPIIHKYMNSHFPGLAQELQ